MRHAARQLPSWLIFDVGQKMKAIAYLITLLLAGAPVFGTEQYTERILVDGKEYALLSFPLEKYFYKFPAKRPGLETSSTALYRGYIGHYEIAENELRLRELVIYSYEAGRELISVIGKLFPSLEERRLSFFTGLLVMPTAENGQPISWLSDPEMFRIIAIRDGGVVADRIFSKQEFSEYAALNESRFGKVPRPPEVSEEAWNEGRAPIYHSHRGHVVERLVNYKDFMPNKAPEPTPGAVTPRANEGASK